MTQLRDRADIDVHDDGSHALFVRGDNGERVDAAAAGMTLLQEHPDQMRAGTPAQREAREVAELCASPPRTIAAFVKIPSRHREAVLNSMSREQRRDLASALGQAKGQNFL